MNTYLTNTLGSNCIAARGNKLLWLVEIKMNLNDKTQIALQRHFIILIKYFPVLSKIYRNKGKKNIVSKAPFKAHL